MRRTITQVLCDMDPTHETPADTTIAFGYNGRQYELDLSEPRAEEFAALLEPWMKAGRLTRRSATARTAPSEANRRHAELRDIRAWARENGYTVSDKGRVPHAVEAQYRASQAEEPTPTAKKRTRRKPAAATAE